MRVMGVELNAAELRYVVIEADGDNYDVRAANRLTLADTRSRSALAAFQSAIVTTLNEASPDLIAVKAKPEAGQMRAGAAALKMEGILLANAHCDTEFVSGARINKIADTRSGLHAYLHPALRTAVAALRK